jgi:hypothetical protein
MVITIAFYNNGLGSADHSPGHALALYATIADNVTLDVETMIQFANRWPSTASGADPLQNSKNGPMNPAARFWNLS